MNDFLCQEKANGIPRSREVREATSYNIDSIDIYHLAIDSFAFVSSSLFLRLFCVLLVGLRSLCPSLVSDQDTGHVKSFLGTDHRVPGFNHTMMKRGKPLATASTPSSPKKAKTGKGVNNHTPHAPRIAPNGYRLPDPLPPGEVLTDNTKNTWTIGQSIGCGGFGEIYAAKPTSQTGSDHFHYVIKVDHQNGPLYAEMYFYHRVAKEESIRNWMREKSKSCRFLFVL